MTTTREATDLPTGTPDQPDHDAARAVWVLIAAGIAAGLPVPRTVSVSAAADVASVSVREVGDVAVWASWLSAPAPTVYSCDSPETGEWLTSTSSSAPVEAGTWLSVYHLHADPTPTNTSTDADAATAVAVEGVSGVDR